MVLLAMNALWFADTMGPSRGASRRESAFANSLAMRWIRLIGQFSTMRPLLGEQGDVCLVELVEATAI